MSGMSDMDEYLDSGMSYLRVKLINTSNDIELLKSSIFKVGSGFSDKERQSPPGIGSLVTYKYFGLTSKGTPRFASFMRIRDGDHSAH